MTRPLRARPKSLKRGGLVAFPTETVYGLGADALKPRAAARIFEVKRRPYFDPLIVHVADFQTVEKICGLIPDRARKLMSIFWPGPLTLVLPRKKIIPDIVTAGLPTVAVRMPDHPVALDLIRRSGTPIAAPSANPFGYLSPTTALHVAQQLGDKVDCILDAGQCAVGIESTILDLSGNLPELLRPGGVALEQIQQAVGTLSLNARQDAVKPVSPGQLPQHYSPLTPMRLWDGHDVEPGQLRGLLAFQTPRSLDLFKAIEVLSPAGDLKESAVNLFSCLHRLDKAGLDMIYAEAVPEIGLGKAIMDRLLRACSRTN